eukprot:TRINITY_DN13538_c0_g1_i1.p1 TRINITY_DN13538_c0_g1~~TRINITY_DN13538_c0_g1_i1.p1  ORF type:complete len:884 (-),score=151.77 TRINITY_DN13538_c0_g1_i1:62-2653(-)
MAGAAAVVAANAKHSRSSHPRRSAAMEAMGKAIQSAANEVRHIRENLGSSTVKVGQAPSDDDNRVLPQLFDSWRERVSDDLSSTPPGSYSHSMSKSNSSRHNSHTVHTGSSQSKTQSKRAPVRGYTKNFHSLLSQLRCEHERQVHSLRQENMQLRHKLGSDADASQMAQSWHGFDTLHGMSSDGKDVKEACMPDDSSRFHSKFSIPSSAGAESLKKIGKHLQEQPATLEPSAAWQASDLRIHRDQDQDQDKIDSLRALFKVDKAEGKIIMASDLLEALEDRSSQNKIDQLGVEGIMAELHEISMSRAGAGGSAKPARGRRRSMMEMPVISYLSFESLILLPELASLASPSNASAIEAVQAALLRQVRITEVPAGPAIKSLASEPFNSWGKQKGPSEQLHDRRAARHKRVLAVLQVIVTLTIVLSTSGLGISMDNSPGWVGWLVFEIFCAFVFGIEVIIKVSLFTPKGYFCGEESMWNILDFLLAGLAIGDVIVSILAQDAPTTGNMYAIFRAFRLARLVRILKLVRIPLLRELASMVSALVLSAPWLFWVIIVLTIIIYMCAIVMRSGVTAIVRDDLETCPHPDTIYREDYATNRVPSQCKLHWLYGREYCPTIIKCSLTIFRCFIGDCTTNNGRSLVAIFSEGWGTPFNLAYCAVMTCVMFGLFNVITATFIEATLTGLKQSENARKYKRLEDRNYIKEKIQELTQVMKGLALDRRRQGKASVRLGDGTVNQPHMKGVFGMSTGTIPDVDKDEEILFFTEGDFGEIIKNSKVRQLLEDLDIVVEPRRSSFEAFDVDGDQQLSLEELIGGLLRVRGELQKLDVVSVQLSLMKLSEQFEKLQNQTEMLSTGGWSQKGWPLSNRL